MALFKFRIIDKHENQDFDEYGCIIAKPFGEWAFFNFALETSETVITSFRSYVLFDSEGNPKECTKVFLSDGSFLFAVNKFDTFEKNYTENYIPLFNIKPDYLDE